MNFETAFASMPLIAILRGVPPSDAAGVGRILCDAGLRIVEVPLHDERTALAAIESLATAIGDLAVVGAGTVTTTEQVSRVEDAGGRLIVSPHTDARLVRATTAAGMVSCPGVCTPTEAFAAVVAGADLLKLFPASLHGRDGLRALKTVLGRGIRVVPVGGVDAEHAAAWRASGAAGLGIGAALYQPGISAERLATRARRVAEAWNRAGSG